MAPDTREIYSVEKYAMPSEAERQEKASDLPMTTKDSTMINAAKTGKPVPSPHKSCACRRCARAFAPYQNGCGLEQDYCPLCDSDNRAHDEWERDSFGDN